MKQIQDGKTGVDDKLALQKLTDVEKRALKLWKEDFSDKDIASVSHSGQSFFPSFFISISFSLALSTLNSKIMNSFSEFSFFFFCYTKRERRKRRKISNSYYGIAAHSLRLCLTSFSFLLLFCHSQRHILYIFFIFIQVECRKTYARAKSRVREREQKEVKRISEKQRVEQNCLRDMRSEKNVYLILHIAIFFSSSRLLLLLMPIKKIFFFRESKERERKSMRTDNKMR